MSKIDELSVPIDQAPPEVQLVTNMVGTVFTKSGSMSMTIGAMRNGQMLIVDCETGLQGVPAQLAKDIAADALVGIVKEGADWVAFWDEAWTVNQKDDSEESKQAIASAVEAAERGELRHHPDRIEILMVTVYKPEGEWLARAKIIRKDEQDQHPTLGPWSFVDSTNMRSSGRFAGMWKQASAETLDKVGGGKPSAN